LSPTQQATIWLTGIAAGATVVGLILAGREWIRSRDDVRFHDHADEADHVAARANLTRAIGLIILGFTDLILCAILVARVLNDPSDAHPWIAVVLIAQAIGFLTLIIGESRARSRIGRG
jgi:hypothetical protein